MMLEADSACGRDMVAGRAPQHNVLNERQEFTMPVLVIFRAQTAPGWRLCSAISQLAVAVQPGFLP